MSDIQRPDVILMADVVYYKKVSIYIYMYISLKECER